MTSSFKRFLYGDLLPHAEKFDTPLALRLKKLDNRGFLSIVILAPI